MQLSAVYANLDLMPHYPRFNSRNFIRPQTGFTLIEVLVSVTIIILVTALAVPNLNRFNEEQLLRSEAEKFVSVIRQAQTNAQAKIQPDGAFSGCTSPQSLYWQVYLSNDATYSMGWICDTSFPSSTDLNSKLTVSLPSNLRINLTCDGAKRINFQANTFNTPCSLSSGNNLVFSFTNTNISGTIITVTLNQGGSIRVD